MAGEKSSNADKYQLWRHNNNPNELMSNKVIDEKINYFHNNPVEEDFVFRQDDFYIAVLLIMREKKQHWKM